MDIEKVESLCTFLLYRTQCYQGSRGKGLQCNKVIDCYIQSELLSYFFMRSCVLVSEAFYLSSSRLDLNDRRTSQNRRVSKSGDIGIGQDGIGLAGSGRRHSRLYLAAHQRSRGGRGAQSTDPGHVEGSGGCGLGRELDGGSLGDGTSRGGSQAWECHNGKRGVGGRAGRDEGGGEGVDLVDSEAGAVGVGGSDVANGEALEGRVDRLSDQD